MNRVANAVPGAAELAARFGADGALLFVVDGQDLTIVDMWPLHPSSGALTLQVGFGVTGRVARTGEAVMLREDSPRNVLHRQLLRLEGHQTIARLCVPLPGYDGQLNSGVVGVLAMHRHPRRPFTDDDLERAQSYAPILGLSLHAEQLWRAVSRHRTERDRLIKKAISAQEAERRRIAFDLHDGVTTALASMAFHLSSADLTVSELVARDSQGDPVHASDLERARAELASVRELTDMAYNQTRAAISGLHSLVLDDLGLVAALETLARTVTGPDRPEVELVVDEGTGIDDIPNHTGAALYRIAQEALANALKHADAERIVLSLRRVGDSIVLGCADDGRGFDLAGSRAERAMDAEGSQHFGLSSVAERCAMIEASLRVESWPGRGTTLLVELPLSEEPDDS